MNRHSLRINRGIWPSLVIGVTGALTGCAASTESISTSRENLIMASGTTPWRNGAVPVCWTTASTNRSDFANRSRSVRALLESSWPSVANVRFTGWDTCPNAGLDPGVNITLDDTTAAGVGHDFGQRRISLGLGTARSDFGAGLIPHEFGHVLGFRHEMARQDFPDNPNTGCHEENVAGDYLNTPSDINSIMASTGYCQNNSTLSPWDAVGAITVYGKQVIGLSPLLTAYSMVSGDNATISTAAGIESVRGANYSFEHAEGWVFDVQIEGTVPLKLYWNPATGDNFTTATAAGVASAVASGYSFVRIEGYVYPSQQPGTVPLNLYFHSHGDNMSTASTSGQNAAIGAGYAFVRTEGWVFPTVPYKTLLGYWDSATGDNVLTARDSTVAQTARASYDYIGMDGVVFKDQLPGTVALKTYLNPTTHDYFGTATAEGEASARGAGYTQQQVEGYVFEHAQNGMSPIVTYWSQSAIDNFLTVNRTNVPFHSDYTFVRIEGYTFPTRL